MKTSHRIFRRMLAALAALAVLAFAAGCDLGDPVVSVGSPLPEATDTAAPTDTVAPETPSAAPSNTPAATASPSAEPAAEANGSGAYNITADTSESQKTYYSELPDENALRVENGALASVDGASVEKRAATRAASTTRCLRPQRGAARA
jgi:hypothetical protein